jgi:hypothetical protein
VVALPPSASAHDGGAGTGTTEIEHTLNINVTLKDRRGRALGHAVDHTRVVAGARTAQRPPYD